MKYLKILSKKILELTNKQDTTVSCSNCENYGSMNCPNSYYCYATKDKPYFKLKKKNE